MDSKNVQKPILLQSHVILNSHIEQIEEFRQTYLTGILFKMGENGAEGLTPINFKTMYYEVSL